MRTEKDEEEGVDGEDRGVSKDVRRSDVSGYRIHPSHPSNHPPRQIVPPANPRSH